MDILHASGILCVCAQMFDYHRHGWIFSIGKAGTFLQLECIFILHLDILEMAAAYRGLVDQVLGEVSRTEAYPFSP